MLSRIWALPAIEANHRALKPKTLPKRATLSLGRKISRLGSARTRLGQFVFLWSVLVLVTFLGATSVRAQVDWVVNISDAGSDPISAGGTIDYAIDVTNNGFEAAPATTLDLDVAAGTTLTTATGTITGCGPLPTVGPGTVTCSVPALASLASVSVNIGVLTTVQGTVNLTASVPTAGDDDVNNNSVTEGTTVTSGADIELSVPGPASAGSGSMVTYSFLATNNGPDTSSNLTLEFPIPTGLANITPPAGCSLSASIYSCTIAGPIADGASVSLDFNGQISAGGGSTVTPLASITGSSPSDPVTINNTATLNTAITAGSDVSIGKSRAPSGSLLIGDTVTFTLSPRYTGGSPSGLAISDTIPANYSIVSVTPAGGSGWACTTVAQAVDCTNTSGSGPGSNVSLGDITIVTTAVSPGSPTNTASISSGGPIDPNLANNTATDGGVTIADPTVDLRANKSGPVPALVVVGNSYNFSISATNLGNASFFGTLVMTDSLPAGLTVNSYSGSGWNCLPATPVAGPTTIICDRVYTSGSPLTAGATTPSLTLQTTATAAGTIANSMTVSSPDANIADLNPANDTTTYTVTGSTGPDAADISLIKSALVPSVVAGEVQTFTLEIVNSGPQSSSNVTLTDNFTSLINNSVGATGAGYISHVINPGAASGAACSSSSSGGTSRLLTCQITTLPICTAGSNCPVVTVEVRPGGNAGPRTNNASVISNTTADPVLGNNDDSDGYSVEARADVTVSKVGSPSPAVAGQNLTYVLTATNVDNGLSTADAVTITDTLPDDLTFISASPSAGTCSAQPAANSVTGPGNNQVVCDLGSVSNGSQRTLTIIVRPNTVTLATTIVNNATVSTSTTETDATNNTASSSTPVQNPVLDLLVNKTDSLDPVAVGEDTVYTVTISNLGPSAAENVELTDLLPPSLLSYQSHTVAAGGSCSSVPGVGIIGGTLICGFPIIAAGDTRTVTVTVRGVNKGVATNTATISSDEIAGGFDSNSANDQVTEATTVRTRADVEVVSKIASADPVNLRDDFDFVIRVRNNTGALLAEADDVEVNDSLPSGMLLTGTPTISVVSGSITVSTCTGAAGGTSFSCDLGTFSSGGEVDITVPVELISVSSLPQVFTNTASISTSSLDIVSSNNSNSGTVSVNSSSLSGQLFRDFNNDALITAGDTGVGGVTMTLTGTSFDGAPVTATAVTAPDGTYTFPFVPQGTYTISRGAVSESNFVDGTNTAGSEGGTAATPTTTTGISLPANTAGTDYLFAIVPTASIGIAKQVNAGPTTNADGSFNVTFRLVVENLSLEPLENIVVTDPLAGGSPLFGTFAALATPATDPLARGQYTLLGAPAGSCGSANAGFDGSGDTTVASGFTVAIGATCEIDLSLRVQPTVPLPVVLPSGGRYDNQATVTGEGALSGQTSATNPQLQDLSDDGANPDANSNGIANEAGENDPTPVILGFDSMIALVKTADISGFSVPTTVGDQIIYSFTVTNTSDVTLSNITLSDPLPGISLSGGPIVSLAPGAVDASTFSATYTLDQDDIDAGSVVNQATVQGTDPFDEPVSDLSGTDAANDDPLVTPITQTPGIALVKVADASAVSSPAMVGELISYSFTITNTGEVTLTDVTLSDPLPGISLSGSPIASMAPGAVDSTTYSATYALTQADLDAGVVENQATVAGDDPFNVPVVDFSGTDASNDIPTAVPLTQSAAITLVKTADVSGIVTGASVGDVIPYSFTITNAGNVTLTNVTLADPLPGIVLSGGPIASLAPGAVDSATFSAAYTVTAADITAGQVVNTATTTGEYGDDGLGNPLTVQDSDTETADTVAIEAVPEVFPPFTTDGGTTTSMLASDTVAGGPATLSNVTISVLASDPELTLDPVTGLITLAPGNPAGEYTVEYEICSVVVPTACDQATETVVQSALPAIETTKTQSVIDNGDGINGVGDQVVYTITVENTGNVPLENLVLVDTLTGLDATPLTLDSGPTFVSASSGSPDGDLQIGETATYTASFTLTIAAVSSGGLSNTAEATGLPVYGPGVPGTPAPISDVSDDGIDSDGNTTDDPTELVLASSLEPTGIIVEKTTPLGLVTRGSVVPYTITVTNENPVVSGSLNIVDVLPVGFLYVPGSAMLDGVAAAVIVSGGVITWPNVPVPPLTTVTATLSARVTTGAQAGEHVNTASVRNPATNGLLAPVAIATVRILPEPVFNCGDIIGKVFDDVNRDGYQNQGEPGIPAVRLAGVDGTLITTDQFGRYHVPCAALPLDRGSNFILKIDTRSLPAGYRLTTENPRVVRLTPGKMTEMNFGASITRIVRIDVNARGFVVDPEGQARLSQELVKEIDYLLPKIADEAVNLRIAFHLPKAANVQDVKNARALMRIVEKYIRQDWPDVGQVKLTIEKTIFRAGQ